MYTGIKSNDWFVISTGIKLNDRFVICTVKTWFKEELGKQPNKTFFGFTKNITRFKKRNIGFWYQVS